MRENTWFADGRHARDGVRRRSAGLRVLRCLGLLVLASLAATIPAEAQFTCQL